MTSDAELLRRFAEESADEAFTEFVRRHIGLVYQAALRQLNGDAHAAEDVAQLVFTALARTAETVSRHPAIVSWLHKTTRYTTAKLRRSEWSRRKREEEAEIMKQLLKENTPPAAWERLRPTIDDALHELNERDREAVLLRFFEGRSFAEIGATLALGENGARMRVERALGKLQALLARRGVTSTSAALGTVLANQVAMGAPAGLAASVAGSALTGAAAGAGVGVAGTFGGFIMTTKGTAAIGAVAALTIATAVYQTNQARAAEAALSAATDRLAALRARLSDLETRTQSAEQARIAPAGIVTHARATNAVNLPTAASTARAEKPKQEKTFQQFLDRDPELQKLRLHAVKVKFKAETGPFLRSIGFTDGQIEQAAELAAQNTAIQLAHPDYAPGNSKPAIDGVKFRSMFGDAAAERFAHYLELRDAAALVDALSSHLFHTTERFTTQQADRLAEIFLAAKTDIISTATNSPGIAMGGALVDWDRVVAQTEPLLSATQMRALRAMAALGRVEAQLAAADSEAALPKP